MAPRWVAAICLMLLNGHTQAEETGSNLDLSHFIQMNMTLLNVMLILLCYWLAYRLLKSRVEILNIQAADFHALADNAHDGIFILQNQNLVYANERAADILGYANEDLLGLQLENIVHPDEVEQIIEIHQRRINGEDVPKQYEATFLNKHGSKVPVELTAAVTSWQGSMAGMVIIRDITDRKLIQQTLMDSEKRYRSLVDNAPDAIIIIDVESDSIIEANEQTCELFKLPKQKLFELNINQISAAAENNSRQKSLHHYLERALHGLPLIFEHRFTDSENNTFSCEVRLSRMPFPKRRLIRASITDISERKLYQTAIKQSEQRLASFFDASFEILLFHENGKILDVNDQVERVFGFTRDEFIGHHVMEYVAPESLSTAKSHMSQGLETPCEIIAIHKDGSHFPVQVQAKTLNQNGRSLRIVSVVDISQIKQTNMALNESRQELQSIIDNMLDTFYRTDTQGKIIMASASVEQLLGYKPEELLNTSIASLYADPYERQFFIDTLKSNNGTVQGYEAALRHKNGTILWVSTNARYRYDTEGNIQGIEGITRDITEQRNYKLALSQAKQELEIKIDRRTRQLQNKISELERIQQALQESEQSFRCLVENAVDIFLLHNIEGRIIDVNLQASKHLGYTRDELLNLNINDIDVGPAPVSFKHIVETLKQQESLLVESILRSKNGDQIPVEVNIGLIKKGNSDLILALARDISHRQTKSSQLNSQTTKEESGYLV